MALNPISRRQFLVMAGSAYAGLVLAGCGGREDEVEATDPAVARAEERRRRPGAAVRDVTLTAAPLTVDLAGLQAETWAYNGALPGPEIRVKAGEVVRARLRNDLPADTTIHWHGIALSNDMDGVPGVTQEPVRPGNEFVYEFTAPDPGTFWFHPHVGLQLDTGLYAPLIVEDPADPGDYDREYTVVVDDWVHGLGAAPEDTFRTLQSGGGAHAQHGAGGGGRAGQPDQLLGGHPGDVSYPLFLMNGRPPKDPPTFEARRGERVRLRILNAGGDSPFRVALGGHRLTVTHTDGFPVEPVVVDALLMGMAERYDVVVDVTQEGVFPLVALAEGKANHALGLLRSGSGPPPPPNLRPAELNGRLLALGDLTAAPAVALPPGAPDRTHPAVLGGGEEGYRWTINGRAGHHEKGLKVREGERVRLAFHNRTAMFHPMHLHGHTFQVQGTGTAPGPRKDTVIVRPDERLAVDLVADNPGQWMLHCHNAYHLEGGMATMLSYVS